VLLLLLLRPPRLLLVLSLVLVLSLSRLPVVFVLVVIVVLVNEDVGVLGSALLVEFLPLRLLLLPKVLWMAMVLHTFLRTLTVSRMMATPMYTPILR
jgi:hypothetical protein